VAEIPTAAIASSTQFSASSAAAKPQSCDNAYDRTGLGGAGVGRLTSVGKGKYQLSIGLNPDVQALLRDGIIWPAAASIWSEGNHVTDYVAGHPRPVDHTFYALIKLQGAKYGPRKRLVLGKGDTVVVRIHLTVTTPTTLAYVHGRIQCTI
jgi:hypothetical protein